MWNGDKDVMSGMLCEKEDVNNSVGGFFHLHEKRSLLYATTRLEARIRVYRESILLVCSDEKKLP
jgi:hypothetical protein